MLFGVKQNTPLMTQKMLKYPHSIHMEMHICQPGVTDYTCSPEKKSRFRSDHY